MPSFVSFYTAPDDDTPFRTSTLQLPVESALGGLVALLAAHGPVTVTQADKGIFFVYSKERGKHVVSSV
jgi:hypothetical protein